MAVGKGRMPGDDLVLVSYSSMSFLSLCYRGVLPIQSRDGEEENPVWVLR